MSIESQPLKASQSINAIDLTRDESPAAYSEMEANSDGPYVVEGVTNPISEPFSFPERNEDITQNRSEAEAANAPIVLDSDEEDQGSSSESDVESGDVEIDEISTRSALPYGTEEIHDSEDEESIIDVTMGISVVTSGVFSEENDKPARPALAGALENFKGFEHGGEGYDDEDYESDFGLSEAGKDGLQRLRDDGLLGNVEDIPYQQVGEDTIDGAESAPEITGFDRAGDYRKVITFAGDCWVETQSLTTADARHFRPRSYPQNVVLEYSSTKSIRRCDGEAHGSNFTFRHRF